MICRRCLIDKPAERFDRSSRNICGYDLTCKDCRRKMALTRRRAKRQYFQLIQSKEPKRRIKIKPGFYGYKPTRRYWIIKKTIDGMPNFKLGQVE